MRQKWIGGTGLISKWIGETKSGYMRQKLDIYHSTKMDIIIII